MSRIDTSSVPTNSHYLVLDHYYGNVYTKTDSKTSLNVAVKQRDRSDIVKSSPDSFGFRPPLPYSAVIIEETPFSGYATQTQRMHANWDQVTTCQGNLQNISEAAWRAKPIHYPSDALNSFPSGLEARAMNRALLRIKDQEVNYAVALAEGRKTVDTVVDAAKALTGAIRGIKKGDMRAAQRALSVVPNMKNRRKARGRDEVTGRWLELQYGWLPVLSDVYGTVKDLDKGFLREPRYSATYTTRERESYKHSAQNGYVYWEDTNVEVDHLCKVRLDYTLEGVDLSLATRSGFTNPAEIAWELVPYSFVVDWFVPIGEYIQTLDTALFSTFRGGTVTKVTEIRTTGSLKEYGGQTMGRKAQAKATAFRKYFSRNVISNPSGGLYIKNPFSAKKAVTSLALLNQAVKHHRT